MTTAILQKTSSEMMTDRIIRGLRNLPTEYLPEVLRFVEFLEHKHDDTSEDEALWDAVQANQAYKAGHPAEEPERYKSGEDFLKAVEDL